MQINKHFDSKAQRYSSERSKGLLGRKVKREMDLVMNTLDVKKNEVILDAGCGSGDYCQLIKGRGGIPYGVDFSQKMIDVLLAKGFKGEVQDLDNLILNKNFDKIVSSGALEFVKSPIRTLRNLYNHLKFNGKVVLLIPSTYPGGWLYKLYHLSHGICVRLFSKREIIKLMKRAGFNMISVKKVDNVNCYVVSGTK